MGDELLPRISPDKLPNGKTINYNPVCRNEWDNFRCLSTLYRGPPRLNIRPFTIPRNSLIAVVGLCNFFLLILTKYIWLLQSFSMSLGQSRINQKGKKELEFMLLYMYIFFIVRYLTECACLLVVE